MRTKVYKNDDYSPWGHILTKPLPGEFEFLFLIGQKNIFLANQRRGAASNSGVFLNEVVFLIDQTGCLTDKHSDLTWIKLLKTVLIHCTTRHAFSQPKILFEPIVNHVYYHEMSQQQ